MWDWSTQTLQEQGIMYYSIDIHSETSLPLQLVQIPPGGQHVPVQSTIEEQVHQLQVHIRNSHTHVLFTTREKTYEKDMICQRFPGYPLKKSMKVASYDFHAKYHENTN